MLKKIYDFVFDNHFIIITVAFVIISFFILLQNEHLVVSNIRSFCGEAITPIKKPIIILKI